MRKMQGSRIHSSSDVRNRKKGNRMTLSEGKYFCHS